MPAIRHRIRVVHLTSVHPWDDTRIYRRMCRALADAGFEVHLVAPCDGAQAVESGPTIVHCVRRGSGRRLQRITRTVHDVYCKALELDGLLYHFHDPELLPVGAALAARGKQVIYDVHEDLPSTILDKPWLPHSLGRALSRPVAWVEGFWARRAAAVIGAEGAITDRFRDLSINAVSIQNFPRLADFPAVHPGSRERERGLLVSFGGLNGHRCADTILEALSLLQNEIHYRFVVAGNTFGAGFEGPLRALPAYEHMQYLGRISQVAMREHLYRAQIAFVLYSPSPNHLRVRSNRFFEAMAAGIPVITSDFPQWRAMVDSIGCGLSVSPRDPEAIAAAVRWLLAHPEEAAAMGRRGRAAVEERFNWEREEGRLLDLYRGLLSLPHEFPRLTCEVRTEEVMEHSLSSGS